MSLVDYTLDIKVDPNGRIVITATTIAATGLLRSEAGYEYFDYGAGHFVDFEHLFNSFLNSSSDSACIASGHLLANAVNTDMGLETADDHHIKLWVRNSSGTLTLTLVEWYSGTRYQDGVTGLSLDATYYHTFKYVSSTKVLTCKIYSDSGRTTLVDTLTLTLHAAATWRYRYSLNSFADGVNAFGWTGVISGTDLQELATIVILRRRMEGY